MPISSLIPKKRKLIIQEEDEEEVQDKITTPVSPVAQESFSPKRHLEIFLDDEAESASAIVPYKKSSLKESKEATTSENIIDKFMQGGNIEGTFATNLQEQISRLFLFFDYVEEDYKPDILYGYNPEQYALARTTINKRTKTKRQTVLNVPRLEHPAMQSNVQITEIPSDSESRKMSRYVVSQTKSTISWYLDQKTNEIVIERTNGSRSSFACWYSILDLQPHDLQQLMHTQLQNATDDANNFVMDLRGQIVNITTTADSNKD
ncbi:hypothetical protein E3N88_03816 [Mikania micrantha]|uniref:Uncharacterized protein n=1 Tax=Mikania micrantha TaxID=192012 RepID=A0A5N6PUP7_9ASTR|nr:hypothetical protein E3N88_03816 [Mikania micrantha]